MFERAKTDAARMDSGGWNVGSVITTRGRRCATLPLHAQRGLLQASSWKLRRLFAQSRACVMVGIGAGAPDGRSVGTLQVCGGVVTGTAAWYGLRDRLHACRGPAALGRGMGMSRGAGRAAAPLRQETVPAIKQQCLCVHLHGGRSAGSRDD